MDGKNVWSLCSLLFTSYDESFTDCKRHHLLTQKKVWDQWVTWNHIIPVDNRDNVLVLNDGSWFVLLQFLLWFFRYLLVVEEFWILYSKVFNKQSWYGQRRVSRECNNLLEGKVSRDRKRRRIRTEHILFNASKTGTITNVMSDIEVDFAYIFTFVIPLGPCPFLLVTFVQALCGRLVLKLFCSIRKNWSSTFEARNSWSWPEEKAAVLLER